MSEVCEDCICGLDNDEIEHQTEVFGYDFQFGKAVRDFVIDRLDVESDEGTFVKEVVICPEQIEVTYEEWE